MVRQFPAALKLYDRALDIIPNDPQVTALKAHICQAQGKLQQADSLLSEINEQTPNEIVFLVKITQLRLDRNYSEAIRLLQTKLAQFHYTHETYKAGDQIDLAWIQRLAGDTAGTKASAEQARNTIETLYRDQPDNPFLGAMLSKAYAAMGEKDLALKTAEHAIMVFPSAKEPMGGPKFEENLAFIQAVFGENDRAISTLTRLLQIPYDSWFYGLPITSALLRLDPLWDPLRGDPAFQKLCEEKQP